MPASNRLRCSLDRMKKSIPFLILTLTCLFSACATRSTEPSVTSPRRGVGVSGVEADTLRQSLVRFISENGYELTDSDQRTLDFDRPASKWAALRYGSFVNPETYIRMKVILMDVGPSDHWVSFEPLVGTERGSGFESNKPLKGTVTREMQSLLEQWQTQRGKNDPKL